MPTYEVLFDRGIVGQFEAQHAADAFTQFADSVGWDQEERERLDAEGYIQVREAQARTGTARITWTLDVDLDAETFLDAVIHAVNTLGKALSPGPEYPFESCLLFTASHGEDQEDSAVVDLGPLHFASIAARKEAAEAQGREIREQLAGVMTFLGPTEPEH